MEIQNKLDIYDQRLLNEWKKYGKIVIGVDFDSTIYPYHTINNQKDIKKVISTLQIAHATGAYITIFTCSAPDRHQEIQEYCDKIKLPIDSININPVEMPYGHHGKIYANIYLDDRGGLRESIERLDKVMYKIRGEKANNLTLGESC